LEAELVGELVAEGTVLGSQAGDLGWSGPRGGLPQRATLILQPTAGGRTPGRAIYPISGTTRSARRRQHV